MARRPALQVDGDRDCHLARRLEDQRQLDTAAIFRPGYCAAEGADPLAYCTLAPAERTMEPVASRAGYHADSLARDRQSYPAVRASLPRSTGR